MSTQNVLLVSQLALQLTTQLQSLLAVQAQAHAENRDITDAEVDDAAKGTADAIAALNALIAAKVKP